MNKQKWICKDCIYNTNLRVCDAHKITDSRDKDWLIKERNDYEKGNIKDFKRFKLQCLSPKIQYYRISCNEYKQFEINEDDDNKDDDEFISCLCDDPYSYNCGGQKIEDSDEDTITMGDILENDDLYEKYNYEHDHIYEELDDDDNLCGVDPRNCKGMECEDCKNGITGIK
jgi:hypothetical protein